MFTKFPSVGLMDGCVVSFLDNNNWPTINKNILDLEKYDITQVKNEPHGIFKLLAGQKGIEFANNLDNVLKKYVNNKRLMTFFTIIDSDIEPLTIRSFMINNFSKTECLYIQCVCELFFVHRNIKTYWGRLLIAIQKDKLAEFPTWKQYFQQWLNKWRDSDSTWKKKKYQMDSQCDD